MTRISLQEIADEFARAQATRMPIEAPYVRTPELTVGQAYAIPRLGVAWRLAVGVAMRGPVRAVPAKAGRWFGARFDVVSVVEVGFE